MCRKFIINQYFPPTRFIQYGNFYSITKSGTAIYKDNINILNKCIISDFIVRNVVLDVFNTAVISYCYVVQGDMP